MRNWGFRVNYLLKSRFFVFILLSALVLSSLAPFFINSEVCRTEDSSSSTQNVEIEPDDIIELTNSHNSDKTVNPNADLNIKPLLTPDQKSSPITNSGSTLNNSIRTPSNNYNNTRAIDYDQTPALEWLETILDFTYVTPIHLSGTAKFKIREIYLPGYGRMTADAIRKQYEIEASPLQPNPPIKYKILDKIDDLFETLLNRTFPNSIYILDLPKLNNTSIYNLSPDEDQFDPPIRITHYCTFLGVNNSAYFSPDELARYKIKSASDLLEGSLKLGATVTTDISLFANAGHYNRYRFKVRTISSGSGTSPEQLLINHKSNEIPYEETQSRTIVQFSIDNTKGINNSVKFIKGMVFQNRNPNVQIKEKIQIDYNILLLAFDSARINQSKFIINSIKLNHMLHRLPSNISEISILSADGIRLFYDNGIINFTELQQELDDELNSIITELKKTFNSTSHISLNLNWNQSTVTGLSPLYYLEDIGSLKRMGIERPITGYLVSYDEIKPNYFENISEDISDIIKGLMNAGAEADWDLSISSKFAYTYDLTLPPGFKLKNLNYSTGSSSIGYTYDLTPQMSKNLVFVSSKPAHYLSSQAEINVKIDFHEIDILSFTEYLGSIKIESTGSLYHIKLNPDSRFAKALPKHVTMDYYNSDALRILHSNGLLNTTEIEDDMYAIIKENISKMLDEDTKMSVNFDENLLRFDGDINQMDDEVPIEFEITASGKMRITDKKSVKLGSFITKQVELPITGIEDWNVTYTLILPKYIEILGTPWVDETDTRYYGPFVERTSDDRQQLTVSIDGDFYAGNGTGLEITVNLDIDLTIWFFLSKIVIPILLFIILLIIIILIYFFRKHKAKKLDKLLDETDYILEDEDNLSTGASRAESYIMGPEGRGGPAPERDLGKSKRKYIGKSKGKGFTFGAGRDKYSARLRELAPGIAPERKLSILKSKTHFGGRSKDDTDKVPLGAITPKQQFRVKGQSRGRSRNLKRNKAKRSHNRIKRY